MIIWEREKQCRNCWYECGWDDPTELREDGSIVYDHQYDCKLGNNCHTDIECPEFKEEEE